MLFYVVYNVLNNFWLVSLTIFGIKKVIICHCRNNLELNKPAGI